MKTHRDITVVLLITSLLVACSSGVTRPQDPEARQAAVPVVLSRTNQVRAVTISVTGKAKDNLAENLKFNQNILLDHIKRALEARELLNAAEGQALPTLDVTITEVRVRSNFNAVMWGFMAGSDHIKGDITLRAADGTETDRFTISASYGLGGLAGGRDEARMGWLYEKFAEEAVNELIGAHAAGK